MSENQIIRKAGEFSEAEIQNLLLQLAMTRNKYWVYLSDPKDSRKVLYMKFMDGLINDRKSFLNNPSQELFARQDTSISVLDSIEQHALNKMSLSLDHRKAEQIRFSGFNPKMWKS